MLILLTGYAKSFDVRGEENSLRLEKIVINIDHIVCIEDFSITIKGTVYRGSRITTINGQFLTADTPIEIYEKSLEI